MPGDAYRPAPPDPEGGTELARLAAKGQQRLSQASASHASVAQETEQGNLRVALGGRYGAPARTASYALMTLGAALVVPEFFWTVGTLLPGFFMLLGGVLVRIFAAPVATRRSVTAERAWMASLPFALEGYFEALEAQPELTSHLDLTLHWVDARRTPDDNTVQGVLGSLDTSARVASRGEEALTIRSGPISGGTRIRVNRVWVYRNTRLVTYVHDLMGKVLLPIHRTHAIAQVALKRT